MKYEICNGKWERLAETIADNIRMMNINRKHDSREGFLYYLNLTRGVQETLNILGISYEYKTDPDTHEVIGVMVAGVFAKV